MAGDVLNIKVCSPLKLRSGLKGMKPAICHYSYNLPLCAMQRSHRTFKHIWFLPTHTCPELAEGSQTQKSKRA